MTVRVQTADFSIADEIAGLTRGRTDIGAVVTFSGTVRGEAAGKPISAITLEHYPEMTELELHRIVELANARWPLQGVTVVHRVGRLEPGENIVLVVTASAHRAAAFEAAEFLMDYLKTDAPFWKKEDVVGDGAHWVDARETDTTARDRWTAGSSNSDK